MQNKIFLSIEDDLPRRVKKLSLYPQERILIDDDVRLTIESPKGKGFKTVSARLVFRDFSVAATALIQLSVDIVQPLSPRSQFRGAKITSELTKLTHRCTNYVHVLADKSVPFNLVDMPELFLS